MRRASRLASAILAPWCRRIDSAICSPTVNTGLREVIGSWKIIAISAPRIERIVCALARTRSTCDPSSRTKSTRPEVMVAPPCSTRRISDSAVTDLPEPDSPTIATVSPRPTRKETSRTAETIRSVLRNSTDKCSTSSNGDASRPALAAAEPGAGGRAHGGLAALWARI